MNKPRLLTALVIQFIIVLHKLCRYISGMWSLSICLWADGLSGTRLKSIPFPMESSLFWALFLLRKRKIINELLSGLYSSFQIRKLQEIPSLFYCINGRNNWVIVDFLTYYYYFYLLYRTTFVILFLTESLCVLMYKHIDA